MNFATNKHNNNILDVLIHPLDKEIIEVEEAESPDNFKEEAGTDRKWLKIAIKNEVTEEDEEEVVETKKIDYKMMNDLLKKTDWKCQDQQDDIHDSETCGVCELVKTIRAAEFQATSMRLHKKKKLTIPHDLKLRQREKMLETKKNSHISEEKYREESWLYNEMCKESYVKDQRKFNQNLEKDLNAIYKPLKNQNKGGIEALKDKDVKLETEPKKVAVIHAEELTKTISSKEPFQFIYEN